MLQLSLWPRLQYKVFMFLQGPRTVLDNSSNNFERGAVDTFLLKKHINLGQLTAVRIGHDNKGLAPGESLKYMHHRCHA